MALQAHNLQAHAQQLEVESTHAPATHINIGLQHQLDQVRMHALQLRTVNAQPFGAAEHNWLVLQLWFCMPVLYAGTDAKHDAVMHRQLCLPLSALVTASLTTPAVCATALL